MNKSIFRKGSPHESVISKGLRTLAIDVGGTGLKASVLDEVGRMVEKRVRIATPYPCRPNILLNALADMTKSLSAFDRVSIGFPGVVRNGHVITAPHFGTESWRDFPLASALSRRFGKPTRLLNDAEVQGLAVITRRGLEVVLTLGTGVGTAVFTDGRLGPHLELAHHPIHDDKTYDEYLGNAALHAHHAKKWNRRIRKMIAIVHTLLNYDILYIGGGNAAKIKGKLPKNVRLCSNDAGITGGIHLWDDSVRPIGNDDLVQKEGGTVIARPKSVGKR
jgi:polyphosphate glucokinase